MQLPAHAMIKPHHHCLYLFENHVSQVVKPDWLASDQTLCYVHRLRAEGIKAAAEDNGWVNRTYNTLQFVRPIFNDGAKAGDLVALGAPTLSSEPQRHRIVKLINFFGRYTNNNGKIDAYGLWDFEEVRTLIPKERSWRDWFC